MYRLSPLVEGETYHVYNRGAHKGDIFTNDRDYWRFILLLYAVNSSAPVNLRNISNLKRRLSFGEIVSLVPSDKSLVEIFAYCLMPNHFHLVLRQKSDRGLSDFMKKLSTAYAMYFNTKYEHSGTLFQGPYKSKHIADDVYFQWVLTYVHLNPVDLFEPGWKEKGIKNAEATSKFLRGYPYSSYSDYIMERPESILLARDEAPEFLKKNSGIEDLILEHTFPKTKDSPLHMLGWG